MDYLNIKCSLPDNQPTYQLNELDFYQKDFCFRLASVLRLDGKYWLRKKGWISHYSLRILNWGQTFVNISSQIPPVYCCQEFLLGVNLNNVFPLLSSFHLFFPRRHTVLRGKSYFRLVQKWEYERNETFPRVLFRF